MAPCKNLIGERFGKLLVLKRLENTKANKAQWLCRCDCGEEIVVISSPLLTGKKNCCPNCNKKPFREDLTGKKFNRLLVLEYDKEFTEQKAKESYERKTYWKCQCDCGKITYAKTTDLKGGLKKSCGCLQTEISSKIMKEIVQPMSVPTRLVDLTGRRFGKLIVIKRNKDNDSSGKPAWICQCDCGNIAVVPGNSLKGGYTSSCGCIGNSVGESMIKDLLTKEQIKFIQEYIFPDLKYKSYLRYDFAILDKNNEVIGLIEYDGRQHTDITSVWYSEDGVKRDRMKTEYAQHHNIPLLRISFRDKDSLNKIILDWLNGQNLLRCVDQIL